MFIGNSGSTCSAFYLHSATSAGLRTPAGAYPQGAELLYGNIRTLHTALTIIMNK